MLLRCGDVGAKNLSPAFLRIFRRGGGDVLWVCIALLVSRTSIRHLVGDMADNKPMIRRRRAQSLKRSLEGWIGQKNFKLEAIAFAVCLILFGAWFPDGLEDFFSYLQAVRMRMGFVSWTINWKLAYSIFFIGIVVWLVIKKLPKNTQIKVHADQPQTRKVLAVFLSTFGPWSQSQTEKYQNIDELKAVVGSDRLERERMNKTNWAMPLSAIDYHKKTLQEVLVFTSSDSSAEFNIFQDLVMQLHPSLHVKEMVSGGIDFEDIETTFNAVDKLYKNAIASGYSEKDILVDVTGGHKTNSIAAAMATLAAGREFQYLNKVRVVRSFDVDYDSDYEADD